MKIHLNGWICDFLEENPVRKMTVLILVKHVMFDREVHPLGYFLLLPPLPIPFCQFFCLHIVITFLFLFWQSTSGSGFLRYFELKEHCALYLTK